MNKLKLGFVQIYTGNGKGKSTAAIGQAVRASGFGLKTYIAQFMKEYPYNELHEGTKNTKNSTIDVFVYRFEAKQVQVFLCAFVALCEIDLSIYAF